MTRNFIESWVAYNVKSVRHDRIRHEAERLAALCIQDAVLSGYTEQELEADTGDLINFMEQRIGIANFTMAADILAYGA